MGRSFQTEIKFLKSTYNHALCADIKNLKLFILNSIDHPLITIGSGGSLSSAIFATLLHQRTGKMSQYFTPLELITSDYNYENISCLIITAGGSNKDILNSYQYLTINKPLNLAILCGKHNSAIEKKSSNYEDIYYNLFKLPNGKDGYLAVNSLIAFSTLLYRSYSDFYRNHNLPSSIDVLLCKSGNKEEYLYKLENDIEKIKNKVTFLVLYGKWGKPAAYDLESKFSEGALGNVLLADYRNFGHGRHYWLAKHNSKTCVISLITPDEKVLAEKTIEFIPSNIPIIKIESEYSGPIGSLSLLLKIIYFVGIFGKINNIDPGRPKVPEFGRKIYNINIKNKVKLNDPIISLNVPTNALNAILKKIKNSFQLSHNENILKFWINNYDKFVKKLESNQYSSIIFDYDGTLCSSRRRMVGASKNIGDRLTELLEKEIYIGIATGRGKSVRYDLQQIIPDKYWSKIIIGYYNGSDIAFLHDESKPIRNANMDSYLHYFIEAIRDNDYFKHMVNYERRPKQISFTPKNLATLTDIKNLILSYLKENELSAIEALESDHSIDLLAPGVSKINLLTFIKNELLNNQSKSNILCIGDKGHWPGNDFYLLNSDYSLSVDTVSKSPTTCWNLAPQNHKGVQATVDYLNALYINNGKISININNIGGVV